MKILAIALFTILSLATPQNLQDNLIQFDKQVHDFGDFGIDDGPQRCVFTLTNKSDKAIVIQTVISSCGCTTPDWTKEPILPGKQGTVTAEFQNDQGPYPFDKVLSVYITGNKNPYQLNIRGVVHQKAFSIEDTHPVLMGQLRLRKRELELGQIKQGQVKTDSVEVINVGKLPLILAYTKRDDNLQIALHPKKLNAGEKGYIVYTIDTKIKEEWGNVIYPVQLVLNDKTNPVHVLSVRTSIKMNATQMSQDDKKLAPVPQVDKSAIEFTPRKQGTSVEATYMLSNKGKTPLIIYKTDFSHDGVSATVPQQIAVGATVPVKVSIPKTEGLGEVIYTISLTTNAPARPTVNLLLYGTLTK